MGFEQLAAWEQQLPQQAKNAPRKEAPKEQRPTAPPTSAPVDPAVRAIGRLQKQFPCAFPKKPAPKVPLKVGILDDLLMRAADLRMSELELKAAIKVWCKGTRYWSCLVEGGPRVDLSGQPAGEVTRADAVRARQLRG
ncbi:ProQ/FinO family protein [Caballeronia hypogeia]|uniref:ProQ/FinO family protein n=1 Tax=Caballeronia hypogeia TaxID=1777140 RepID=UPI0007C784DB|nr:ProQ/FinO family protein [Caballeronia hypogeia]